MFSTDSETIIGEDCEMALISAIAQRDRLLMLRPELKILQNYIDAGISNAKTLTEKFEHIGLANANYKNRA